MSVLLFGLGLLVLALPSEAKQLVFKGTPLVNVALDSDTATRNVLKNGKKHEFALLITKENGKYLWESREQRELVKVDSGAFTHFISPGVG